MTEEEFHSWLPRECHRSEFRLRATTMRQNIWTETLQRGASHSSATNSACFNSTFKFSLLLSHTLFLYSADLLLCRISYIPEADSIAKSMNSHTRPASTSLEETNLDEWERIIQDPVQRVAFDRKSIEDELTNEKRVIILQGNHSSSSHCRFWDCSPRKLYGRPNIRSAFRFNVKDLPVDTTVGPHSSCKAG